MEVTIKERLSEILANADLNTTTERQLREQLASQLGLEGDSYSEYIRDEITRYLAERADEEENNPPAKRKSGTSGTATGPATKMQKTASASMDAYEQQLDGYKRVSVNVFAGQVRIDIREFYEDKASGEMKPSPKGISLSLEQWLLLKDRLQDLAYAASMGDEASIALSSNRHAYVSEFKGKHSVHVREMYEKDGKQLPGKKGVSLGEEALAQLVNCAESITEEAQRRGGAPAAAPRPPFAAPAQEQTARRPQQAEAQPSQPSSDSPAGALTLVDIGGNKRAEVKEFKRVIYVDLRETYMKDGQALPGKKGIMLKVPEFKLLAQNVNAITAAVSSGNDDFSLDIGPMRKVTISEFKGQQYVGIREFYEAGGQLKPGIKGLSMNVDQWKKLAAALPQLSASV